jgi:hypothetical protein
MNIDNLVDNIIFKNNIKQRIIKDKNEACKKEKQIKRRCLKIAFDHALCHYDNVSICLILSVVFALAAVFGWCISECFTSIICMLFLIPTYICFGSALSMYIKNCIKEYKTHLHEMQQYNYINVKTIDGRVVPIIF